MNNDEAIERITYVVDKLLDELQKKEENYTDFWTRLIDFQRILNGHLDIEDDS